MKTKYIKSKIISPEQNHWYNIDFYYDVKPFLGTLAMATCGSCKKEALFEQILMMLVYMLFQVLTVPLVGLLWKMDEIEV